MDKSQVLCMSICIMYESIELVMMTMIMMIMMMIAMMMLLIAMMIIMMIMLLLMMMTMYLQKMPYLSMKIVDRVKTNPLNVVLRIQESIHTYIFIL